MANQIAHWALGRSIDELSGPTQGLADWALRDKANAQTMK